MSQAQSVNKIDSIHSTSTDKKHLIRRLSTSSVAAEREMHTQANQRVVILSPHSINLRSEKYDYYLFADLDMGETFENPNEIFDCYVSKKR